MEQQSIGNGIALINFERAYANSVVSISAMDRIIDIFGRRNGRDSFTFLLTCVMGSW